MSKAVQQLEKAHEFVEHSAKEWKDYIKENN